MQGLIATAQVRAAYALLVVCSPYTGKLNTSVCIGDEKHSGPLEKSAFNDLLSHVHAVLACIDVVLACFQDIVNAVIGAQSSVAGEAIGTVDLDDNGLNICLSRAVTLPELRRHKRAFLKLATQNNWTRLQNARDARHMFVEYLQNNVSL